MKQTIQDALSARGYDSLTPVQEAVINPDLVGADLLVSAQTGSGKTVGFGLSIAPTLLGEGDTFDAAGAPLGLVIAPTRELALQVKRELQWLYAQAGAQLASCVGGMDMRDERRALARGAHIVVATPGRLRDHITRGSIDLSGLRAVVLDEADEMLDLGFREDLEFILGEAPEDRQTLLFSATVPKSITHLAKNYQRDAVRVVTKSETSQHADIEYRAMSVADRDVDNAVINTLRFYEAPNAIVFGNTRAMVNRLTTRLSNRGFQVVALSGELSQAERTHALQAMRDGRANVCVATDVAARGIDLPNLDLVIHAELPSNHETMLHRSGRTGRAGRKGVSALIVTRKNSKKAQRILGGARVKADWTSAPSADDVKARDQERMLADPVWTDAPEDADIVTIQALSDSFSPEQLAAAYLRLYRASHTAPEELLDVDAKPAPRKEFGASVWFSISGGRAGGAEPRRLLPMLCKVGDLTKDDIGAIRIQQDQSYVQILETSVPAFLAAIGPDMKVEEGATLTQLAEGPNLAPSGRDGFKRGGKPGKPHRGKGAYESSEGRPRREPREKRDSRENRSGDTKPVDWNDAPAPRTKKPKPTGAPKGGKPRYEGKPRRDDADGGHGPARRRTEDSRDRGPGKAGKPGSKPFAKPGSKPKGPPPPKGKSNSKKNRARAAANAGVKSSGKK
ncbi:DEAD/DEAH box helicase [Shimia abyssi]|uniref:ATP-dependent RNA helicase DeaD n=1 Tax=Shimia abyssi TaxID=1662395 RepID=A0A2P8FBJ3_9RHOB|nr:DEAD/DEAH box helicase [Shimia abyssi]PSL19058.1 ATP-dependent RNA helicase DeaD [Shimia abyssi]